MKEHSLSAMHYKTVLPNGVRVVTGPMTGVRSASLIFYYGVGSRYENPRIQGVSHFLEHMLFKGTEKRPDPMMVSQEIEGVGGILNAGTGRESTNYWCKVPSTHFALAFDVLADILRNSVVDAKELDKERSVIIEEIRSVNDSPEDLVHDVIDEVVFGDQGIGRPIAGTEETVSNIDRAAMVDFWRRNYRPDRILITAAGNVTHEQLLAVAEQHFGGLAGTAVRVDGVPPTHRPGVSIHEKDLEQVHVCLGTPGISHTDEDRYAAHLLNMALGGGMSSRLFQEIRERRGKAYTVYSFLSSYLDAGYVGTYVGTSAEWVREVVEIIRAEQRRTTREGLTAAELARVKTQMKGSMLLGLETSDSRMSRIAKNMIYFGRDVPLEEVAASIDRVTNDDVVRVAQRVFPAGAFGLTVLGDMKGHAVGDEVLRE